MKKLLILMVVTVIMAGCSDEYVQYVPVYIDHYDRHKFKENKNLMNDSHYDCFKKYISKRVKYKEKDGHIYIPKNLSNDKDLLSNYTKKAEVMRKSGECGQNSQE